MLFSAVPLTSGVVSLFDGVTGAVEVIAGGLGATESSR